MLTEPAEETTELDRHEDQPAGNRLKKLRLSMTQLSTADRCEMISHDKPLSTDSTESLQKVLLDRETNASPV